MPRPYIPQNFENTVEDLLYLMLLELRQIRINTTPAVIIVVPPVPVVHTRVYFGFDDLAPITAAQILASAHFIDVVTGSDYSIDFTANQDSKICWFAENVDQQAKTEIYMTALNNFTIGADQTIEGFMVIGQLRLYQTAFKTEFTDISQIKKTA